jgi:acyl-coenzyme A synthetase/AMP-(fatty) acid ligase
VVLEKGIDTTEVDKTNLQTNMQTSIKAHLNLLFGISDVVIVESLPQTASNKVT